MNQTMQIKSPAEMTSLRSRVAFVTGAGSGIGRAGACAMARCGAHVVVTDRDATLAAAVADEISTEGLNCSWLQLDVSDDGALRAAISETAKAHGRLDVLHSHAGIQIEGKLEHVSASDMDASWALNVRSHFVAAQAAITPMRNQGGGSIINISTFAAFEPSLNFPLSSIFRTALASYTKLYSSRFGADNIRMNNILPGYIESYPVTDEALEEIPLGRSGKLEEIGKTAAFLASDGAAYITGENLKVDGGITKNI